MVTGCGSSKPSYRTALLTNNVKEFGEGWRSTIPVDELFDVVIDSSHVGARKPEPAYFAHALDAVGVEADEAVFLDDMLCNVEGARDFGLTAIHVTDVARPSTSSTGATRHRPGRLASAHGRQRCPSSWSVASAPCGRRSTCTAT